MQPIGAQILNALIDQGIIAEALRSQETETALARLFLDLSKGLRDRCAELKKEIAELKTH